MTPSYLRWSNDGSTVILHPFRQQITPLWSYLTYLLLQIILSVSKSNLTEELLPQNRWRLYCSKITLAVSLLSRNSNWGHVTYSFWAASLYVSCFKEFERAVSSSQEKNKRHYHSVWFTSNEDKYDDRNASGSPMLFPCCFRRLVCCFYFRIKFSFGFLFVVPLCRGDLAQGS